MRGSLSLGAIWRLLVVLPPLKYTYTPYFWHVPLRLSLSPFIIWHHYVFLFLVASQEDLVFLLVFMGWCFHAYLYPVECPHSVFAFCQDFLQMLLFLWQQFRAWAYGDCPVVQGAYHIVFGTDSMMAVPLHVQICMCRLPKDRCGNLSIFTWC